MTHLHRWTPLVKDVAYFQKGEQLATREYAGIVHKCSCGKMRFVPEDRRLRTVFVEIERRHAKD